MAPAGHAGLSCLLCALASMVCYIVTFERVERCRIILQKALIVYCKRSGRFLFETHKGKTRDQPYAWKRSLYSEGRRLTHFTNIFLNGPLFLYPIL